MKIIVNSEQMKECDSNTINKIGIPSLVLMERAALSVVSYMPKGLADAGDILIACGNGNNGADGLAIARLLHESGRSVAVCQIPGSSHRSPENKTQLAILDSYGIVVEDHIPQGKQYACVIDALFGVGLSREPEGIYAEWIHTMNALCGYKIAVDMPSGISSDTGHAYPACFEADLTVTFAYQKAGQIFYPGCLKCGKTVVAQIGITGQSWMGKKPSCYTLGPEDLSNIPKRPARSHKGTFGKVLVIAGSNGMAGAALFCAQAAYCTGCGLVKIFTPESNRIILQSSLPEAILSCYDSPISMGDGCLSDAILWADAIVLGPGLGTDGNARSIVEQAIKSAEVPVVVDADALNILSSFCELSPDLQRYQDEIYDEDDGRQKLLARNLDLLRYGHQKKILTPHLGEMARLTGKPVKEIQGTLLETATEFAASQDVICVLKDAVTVTATKDRAYLNTSGCSAMAKGGSGDVLSGMIASLIAQGMPPGEAAPMAVYAHGLAGEAAAKEKGSYSVLARDIIGNIENVLKNIPGHIPAKKGQIKSCGRAGDMQPVI